MSEAISGTEPPHVAALMRATGTEEAVTTMTVFKTRVDVIDGMHVHNELMDTISWREKLWLVPKWQRARTAGSRQPVRLIRPELFQFERPAAPAAEEDYYLACAVPKTVLDGLAAAAETIVFEVVEVPPIEFPIPTLQ